MKNKCESLFCFDALFYIFGCTHYTNHTNLILLDPKKETEESILVFIGHNTYHSKKDKD